ncbi:hypothetical protein [Pseudomaricurvus sp. HS19]|uniref:hypothetical protein n=1 Tax=Pseudomaricurvus sp. HS19 TaxID=2692626 RepID=UPI00136D720F|nr:hypothetical protein [Pseudomaricurvus sp. HS19]MYM65135.1 hypothetical protein [Pseudomaricurvus sp. HS19]
MKLTHLLIAGLVAMPIGIAHAQTVTGSSQQQALSPAQQSFLNQLAVHMQGLVGRNPQALQQSLMEFVGAYPDVAVDLIPEIADLVGPMGLTMAEDASAPTGTPHPTVSEYLTSQLAQMGYTPSVIANSGATGAGGGGAGNQPPGFGQPGQLNNGTGQQPSGGVVPVLVEQQLSGSPT